MPILVHVSELEPGMSLACNVTNRYSRLLPHGHVLKEKDIIALRRTLPDASIQIIDPLLDQMVEFQDYSKEEKVAQQVRKGISVVAHKVSQQVKNGVTLNAENIIGMQKVIEEMMQYMQENPITLALLEQSNSWDDYLQEHSANVFYLSLVIGNTIRNYIKNERERLSAASSITNAMNLTPLATAALFHDIGMVPLEKLYHKEGPLTDQEKNQIRQHPQTGADMLPDKIDPMVKLIIRHHHENFDGTGYPEGIKGDKMNIFARILRGADAYSAAIAKKVYQNAKPSVQVLYEMICTERRHHYDPIILKVLAGVVQPFPIGAKIQLSNNLWAVVTHHNQKNPFKPQIIIAFDELGDPLAQESLEPPFYLDQRKDIMLKSFAGQNLDFLNQPVSIDTSHDPSYDDILDFAFP